MASPRSCGRPRTPHAPRDGRCVDDDVDDDGDKDLAIDDDSDDKDLASEDDDDDDHLHHHHVLYTYVAVRNLRRRHLDREPGDEHLAATEVLFKQ